MASADLSLAMPQVRSRPGAWHLFWRHGLARTGLMLLGLLLLVALLAPVLGHGDPGEIYKHGADTLALEPPSARFWLGTNTLGQDTFTRLLYGARVSLAVALCAMLTSTFIGTTVGLVGGYFGGRVDILLTRFTEIITSLPTILLAITLSLVLPSRITEFCGYTFHHPPDLRFFKLLFAIGLVTWTGIARSVRGQTMALKEREFVEAARAMGCGHLTILRRHLLPNVVPTVIVLATLATANNLLLEAGLAYLGLGLERSVPSWGGMISDGQPYLLQAPFIALAPGVAIVLAVSSFNLVGTALQEAMEPRR